MLYLSSICSFLTQWVQLGHCRLALQGIQWLSAHNLQCISSHSAQSWHGKWPARLAEAPQKSPDAVPLLHSC